MTGSPLTTRQARRRFVLLSGLRWLPVGLTAPLTVLLATSRGLSPVQIAVAFGAHGVVIVLLELPTGGLADALGRRPVLLASGACNLGAVLGLAVAQDAAGFAAAYALLGVGRALDSGPLEAWFVDAVHARGGGPDDTTPGLARAGSAEAGSLAAGVLLGGAVPLLGGPLALPLLLAAGLTLAQLVAVALLVVEPPRGPVAARAVGPFGRTTSRPRHRASRAVASLRSGVRDVPRTVREVLGLARADAPFRRLLLLSVGTGWVLSTIELVGPLRLVEITGSEDRAAGAFSVLLFAGFSAAGLGAAVAGPARRRAGGAGRASTVLAVVGAVALLGLVSGSTVWLVVAAAAGFYAANGVAGPLHSTLLHQRVSAGHRATALSTSSLALQLGGLVAGVVSAALFARVGHEAAFGLACVVLLATGALALRLPDGTQALPEPSRAS